MVSKMTKEEFIATHLKENSYPNSKLRGPLLRFGLKENKCEICGLSEWNGKPLTCQLHHINGNRRDNRLENLQMLCPNCHSQTENYMNKNTFIYDERAKVCPYCGKPFVAKGDSQRFCSRECSNAFSIKNQRSKECQYSKEYLQELCEKYNTLDEIGFIIHRTRDTVKRQLIMQGLFEDFKRKRNFNSTPVLQYDLEGNLIKEWPSIHDVEESLKISHIGFVCEGRRKSAGGFLWKYKDPNNHNNYSTKPIPILQCDMQENILKEYPSIAAASKDLNLDKDYISKCLKGFRDSAGGYIWKRKIVETDNDSSKSFEILQYNVEGLFIKEYKTIDSAFEETGINKSSIINCLEGKKKQAGGFVWIYKVGAIKESIEVPEFDYIDTTPVQMLDISGNVINEFPSIKSATEFVNTSRSNILHCLRGNTESACGYIWRYKKYSKKALSEDILNRPLPAKIFQSKVNVLQYDLDGCFIKEYESMAAASEATGINHSHIAQCTYGDRDRAGNYMWKIKEGEDIALQINPYKERPRRAIPVLQYDKEGNFVQEYWTMEEVLKQFEMSRATLTRCLSDPKKSYCGYVWRNKKGDVPQTIDISEVIFDSKWGAPVIRCDTQGNFIQEYASIKAAAKETGLSRTHIKNSIMGHAKTLDDYIWKYKS